MTAKLPRPGSADEFEEICVECLRLRWGDANAQRFGRSGQAQGGVDIFGHPHWLNGATAAAQCKNVDRLSLGEIVAELNKLRDFPSPIAEYYVLIGGPRDANLQSAVLQSLRSSAHPPVVLLFWPDIVQEVSAVPELVAKYWSTFGNGVPAVATGAAKAAQQLLSRTGVKPNETTALDIELILQPLATLRIDAHDLRVAFEGHKRAQFIRVMHATPLSSDEKIEWSTDERVAANVLEKRHLELLEEGTCRYRWSEFSNLTPILVDTRTLLGHIPGVIQAFAAAVAAVDGDATSSAEVRCQLALTATSPPRLIDNAKILEKALIYATMESDLRWRIVRTEPAGALAARSAEAICRLISRAVGRFRVTDMPFCERSQFPAVMVDEDALRRSIEAQSFA